MFFFSLIMSHDVCYHHFLHSCSLSTFRVLFWVYVCIFKFFIFPFFCTHFRLTTVYAVVVVVCVLHTSIQCTKFIVSTCVCVLFCVSCLCCLIFFLHCLLYCVVVVRMGFTIFSSWRWFVFVFACCHVCVSFFSFEILWCSPVICFIIICDSNIKLINDHNTYAVMIKNPFSFHFVC